MNLQALGMLLVFCMNERIRYQKEAQHDPGQVKDANPMACVVIAGCHSLYLE